MRASDTIKKFNTVAQQNEETLKKNPYSDSYSIQQFGSNDYGRPPPGSKTEARGKKAGVHVCREILFLMETINENAEGDEPNRWVKFGKLFYIYSFYSDKLVGMLIRARKYGLVHFEGEMLYQRQDDEKIVTMLMPIAEIRESLRATGDPANCVSIRRNSAPVSTTPAFVPKPSPIAEKPKPKRSDSITSSKKIFESSSSIDEGSSSDAEKSMRPKKPWTPKDSSKAPVFCTF